MSNQNASSQNAPEAAAALAFAFTAFTVLPWETQEDYTALLASLLHEHQPQTATEALLVQKMAQSHWLSERALRLQSMTFHQELPVCDQEKKLALYLRYQTTHERAFHKALDQLLKLRAQRHKQEIGSVSQKREEEADARKQEQHEARVRLANAKAEHLELDTEIRSIIQAAIPGHVQIPFEDLKLVLKVALEEVAKDQIAREKAAA